MKLLRDSRSQIGSAALEYIIVSTFGLLLSIIAVVYMGKIAKERLDKLAEKTGVAVDDAILFNE